MKKIVLLLAVLVGWIGAKAQSPVIITQPYKFQKYVSVNDSLILLHLRTGAYRGHLAIKANGTVVIDTATSPTDSLYFSGKNFIGPGTSLDPVRLNIDTIGGGYVLVQDPITGYLRHDTSQYLPNTVISGLSMSATEPSVFITAGVWRIHDLLYSTSTTTTLGIDAQDPTQTRYDAVIAHNDNTLSVLSGTLSTDSATAIPPDVPLNTALVGYVLITPTVVQVQPTPPITNFVTTNTTQHVTGNKFWDAPQVFTNQAIFDTSSGTGKSVVINNTGGAGALQVNGVAQINANSTTPALTITQSMGGQDALRVNGLSYFNGMSEYTGFAQYDDLVAYQNNIQFGSAVSDNHGFEWNIGNGDTNFYNLKFSTTDSLLHYLHNAEAANTGNSIALKRDLTGYGTGTVTSITPGIGFTSHTPITTSGTMDIDTASIVANLVHINKAETILGPKTFNQLLTINLNTAFTPPAVNFSGQTGLQVNGLDGQSNVLEFNGNQHTLIEAYRYNGTAGSKTGLVANDEIVAFAGNGWYDATHRSLEAPAALQFYAGETWSATANGSFATLKTMANGTTVLSTSQQWNGDHSSGVIGNFSVGEATTVNPSGYPNRQILELSSTAANAANPPTFLINGSASITSGTVGEIDFNSLHNTSSYNIARTFSQLSGGSGTSMGGNMVFQTRVPAGSLTTFLQGNNDQTLTFNHYTTNGGIFYGNGSGVLQQSGAITGIVKGNGTSAPTAAAAGTDYQAPITLTTTGTSGAATFVSNTLNIPQYAGFANPMTTAGDIIYGGASGTPTRLGTSTGLLHAGTTPSWSLVALGSDVSGTLQAAQFPALTGDITTPGASLATTLKNTGTAGTYGQVTTDAQGRVSSGQVVTDIAHGGTGSATQNWVDLTTAQTVAGIKNLTSQLSIANTSMLTAFNTVAQTGNTETVTLSFLSNVATLLTNRAGTGTTTRDLQLSAGGNSNVYLSNGGFQNTAVQVFRDNTGLPVVLGVNSAGLTASSGFQEPFAIYPTLTQSSTAGYRALWISPFENTLGSGSHLLIDAGTNTANGGTGTHTSEWAVDDKGHILMNETNNKFIGQTTLVAGTKAITITGVTTGSRAFISFVSQGGTSTGVFQYAGVCTANTLTITAVTVAGVAVTTDTSVLNYMIIN